MEKRKTAVVTGGSSGIGRAVCIALRDAGCTVFSLSRRDPGLSGVVHLSCDVTKEDDVLSAVAAVGDTEGVDILVSCAGCGISGALEFTSPEEAHRQLEVNLFGTDRVVRAALPYLRVSAGRIVLISSVAAAASIPFQGWYSVSKSAINAYALALRNEVRPFGVTVCAVMPGDIATGFTDARRKSEAGDDIYSGRISRSVAVMEKDERNGMSPETAGRFIARTALRHSCPALRTIGFSYKLVVFLMKLLPVSLANLVIGRIYGG